MKRKAQENTGRVVAVGLGFFGSLAAIAIAAGVHTRFEAVELAALGLFGLAFVALTWWLDPQVRAWARRAPGASLRRSEAKSPGRSPAAT